MVDAHYTLNHPEVQKAKRLYERRNKMRLKSNGLLPFDALFRLFSRNCVSFTDIANREGVSRQAIHQRYNRYFVVFFGHRSGRERTRTCTMARIDSTTEAWQQSGDVPEKLKPVAIRARRNGCIVECATKMYSSQVHMVHKRLIINGHLCSVSCASTTASFPRYSQKEYSRVSFRRSVLSGVEFAIVYVAAKGYPKRYFVFLAKMLHNALFAGGGKYNVLYVPMERIEVYRNNLPRIDVWKYEDAWDLIPAPK